MDKSQTVGRRQSIVNKRKLNYQFHNPNSVEATANYILKVFLEVNSKKVEEAIRKAADQDSPETVSCESSSA